MMHFDPGTDTMTARSRLAGRRRVADALVKRNLAAAGYPADARPHSSQRGEISLALARINGRSQAPVQPVLLAFNETPNGPGVAPRALDYGMGRATAMPLHDPAGPTAADAPGRYGEPPTHQIGGDAPPMGQSFGTGANPDARWQYGESFHGEADPPETARGQSQSRTGYTLPIRRDGETGALSLAIPGLAQDVWDEAVGAVTLPGDVYSGKYHLPSLGEPGITEDDGYNVYRDGQLLGNRLANQMSLTNRAIGAAEVLTGGGTGFAATRGPRSAMDPSLLRMGGSASNRPPNMSPPGAGRRGAFREAKRVNDIPVNQQPKHVFENIDRRERPQPGRRYQFEMPEWEDGERVLLELRDDAGGHFYGPGNRQNRGPHFNDPKRNHYDY